MQSSEYGKNEARKSLLLLKNTIGVSQSKTVEVRVYDSLPSVFLVVADERALLGLHMNTGTALVNPHFEVQISRDGILTVLGRMIEAEFEKVTADSFSQKIDLASINPQGDVP